MLAGFLLRRPHLVFFLAFTTAFGGLAWGQRDLTDIPEPNAEAELAAMKIDPASRTNLFAADPDLSKPIQVNFDSAGGLWIASSEVYPQILPGEKANDKIIVLRDTDGDGVADQRTVFADGLLIPTGVLPDGTDAAYVAESTRLVHFQDTDGDGKADKRRVVLSGFGTEDTHHLIHTLRWGPDGCLYFNQSIYIHSHIDTPYGTRHLDGGGIWRYRPSTGQLEVFCKGFVNPWGHVFDANGESFATDGAYVEGINYVFPDSVFVTSPGATRWLRGMNPGSPKHCGLEILSGSHIPPNWVGDFVTNDFRGHRVCRFSVQPSGSGYVGRQQPELITSAHVAFRPIDAKMGPDGAIYVADWYNPIIQHGEVDFRDSRRDRKHGRIWRISFPERELDRWPDFPTQTEDQLFALLEDPSLAVRQFARQELWSRAAKNPDALLASLRAWRDNGDPSRRGIEVLWMNEVLSRASTEDTKLAIESAQESNPAAMRTILRSVWRSRLNAPQNSTQRDELTAIVTSRVEDPDPRVRLEAVVSNGQLNTVEAARQVVAAIDHEIDFNLDFAIWQSLRNLDAAQNGELLSQLQWQGRTAALAHCVRAIGTARATETAIQWLEKEPQHLDLIQACAQAGNASQLSRTLALVLSSEQRDRKPELMQPLLERTARDGLVPENAGKLLAEAIPNVDRLLSSPPWTTAVLQAAATWRTAELEPLLTESLSQAGTQHRRLVIAALGALNSASSRQLVNELASADDIEIRIEATQAIANSRPRAAIEPAIQLLSTAGGAAAGADVIVGMLKRKDLPPVIAQALAGKRLSKDQSRDLLARIRRAGGNAELEAAIRASGQLDDAAWVLTPELSRRILAKVQSEGSAERGEAVYRREKLQCINCHAIGNAGGLVGPNLISVGGSSQPDYIVEALLDPSAKLKEGYTTQTVLTVDAELINGIVVGKTDETIRLRLADGTQREIALDDIEQQKPGKSLMPDGALDALPEKELVDLVAFLSELGRTPNYTVSTTPMVRSLEALIYSNEANRRLNRTSFDTVASDDPAMTWKPFTSMVSGQLPIEELQTFQPHRNVQKTSFVRFSIELPGDGVAGINLPSEGIQAWLDGKPIPTADLKQKSITRGIHQVVLGINREIIDKRFAISLDGAAVQPAPETN